MKRSKGESTEFSFSHCIQREQILQWRKKKKKEVLLVAEFIIPISSYFWHFYLSEQLTFEILNYSVSSYTARSFHIASFTTL